MKVDTEEVYSRPCCLSHDYSDRKKTDHVSADPLAVARLCIAETASLPTRRETYGDVRQFLEHSRLFPRDETLLWRAHGLGIVL